jgi:hypothetical protein
MRNYNQQQFEQMLGALRAFDPALFDNCDGVCWMKQVRAVKVGNSRQQCRVVPLVNKQVIASTT